MGEYFKKMLNSTIWFAPLTRHKKDHTCVTCVNKVVVSCSYTSLTKSLNWLAIRYWGQLLCVYGSLWLVYNVNWTLFNIRA